ncbi:MAG TPA: 2-aminoethylphosphonate--pyruvate transaminase [Geminicoccus sp.]|jgi:2-aminoethylphosphonate-pyruvate transaminase|uniref:2-aminoethylphosphonate--pyruvate transaminase n=1 Tax=Geminicoccus sp. TaxID=2024832 RepID=UPI002E33E0E3|nr:2-aminoethylphosphonate--pyruvate transaminase [Geminicoccus sp.]HEX2525132.1 2-aminoethylphosphonate--pyruvate transaminase [Geminicoccus sp.]
MRYSAEEPLLLTPGPLTTRASVKAAMLRDWGSRDSAFIDLNADVLRQLAALAGDPDELVAVPMQGSGSFAVEAMLGTFLPPTGRILVCVNGAYGDRMVQMVRRHGRNVAVLEQPENQPNDVQALERMLAADPAISHVAVVHCETTSGILNPLADVAHSVARHGRRLLIDAMSTFGALPVDARQIPFDALAASSNKCLEGVPGMGFVIARRAALAATETQAPALCLDLFAQEAAMRMTGQWRFTPPTHVIAALHQALAEHSAEGGVAGRGERYRQNCRILVEGMRALGFETLLPDALQAPIIVTFKLPNDPAFSFDRFYEALRQRGFAIYPGKLTVAPSFRMGCIGALGASEMKAAVAAVGEAVAEMGLAMPAAA